MDCSFEGYIVHQDISYAQGVIFCVVTAGRLEDVVCIEEFFGG